LTLHFIFHYAGYFEDGACLTAAMKTINKTYGKYDENRAHKTDTKLFLFKQEKKDGMIRILG
jgi:hypothetical protein